jgi:ABC-2 type transport system ATP-binding protein
MTTATYPQTRTSIGNRPARHGGVKAIEAEVLRKEFPGGIVAVAGIDLSVREGEVFGFLGPNGAGKTTTVRMLTTLLRPTAGRAAVAGYDLTTQQHEIRRSIGVALQEAGLDPVATGRELLRLQGGLFGLSPSQAGERADELLTLVGLQEAADRQVKTYSGGMKRRLDLASALIHGPRVLFLDEPTEGLDPASRASVWQEIGRLNRTLGVTVFLTTHYLEEADHLADCIAIIDGGRIVDQGSPAALKASIGGDVVTLSVQPDRREAAKSTLTQLNGLVELRVDESELTLFVNNGNGVVANVVRLLDSAGIPVDSVAVTQPSLDEVFLRATGFRLEGAGSGTSQEGGAS